MFVEELIRFGLSEKEAKVYLALLELEVATANEIAKASSVNRSSTYVVLESLQKRGLASVSAGGRVQKYVAAHPEQLARMAGHESQKRLEAKADIDRILPELISLHKDTKERPKVVIYEGIEGLRNCFEATLKSKEKLIRVVSSGNDIERSLPGYLPEYVQQRLKLGIAMYGIHPYTEGLDYLRTRVSNMLDVVQLIPPEKWFFPSDFVVFDDMVGFMIHHDPVAIGIKNESIANEMKRIFDLAFEEAKRLNIPPKVPKG